MAKNDQPMEELLLDLHLDRLDSEQRAWLVSELDRDAELRRKSERLGRWLHPLDQYPASGAPANLSDRVLAFVKESDEITRKTLPFPAESRGGFRPSWFRMREMIAVAACLVLLVGAAVPGLSAVRDRSQRAQCASNLESIFRGIGVYQESYAGSLPYAGGIQNASWLPGSGDESRFASNSRHPFLLVRLKLGPRPKDFLCPSSTVGQPMPDPECEKVSDFIASENVSYDSLNLAGASPNLRPPTALAYMSDANPLFVGARFNADVDPTRTNSPAHRAKGQNVLRLDGSANFVATPVYAPNGDNLWTIANVREYRGTEVPTQPDDAFLVPGFPAKNRH